MTNITYLFGAGASANIIYPYSSVIKYKDKEKSEFKEGNKLFVTKDDFCTTKNQLMEFLVWLKQNNYEGSLVQNVTDLLVSLGKFSTIDIYAKYLWNHNNKKSLELLRLKNTFSTFFFWLQFINNTKTDNRYINFIVSIMDNKQSFPFGCKFLSWNYDFQFELSYCEALNISPSELIFGGIKSKTDLLHLNGCATELNTFKNVDFALSLASKINGASSDISDLQALELFQKLELAPIEFAWENSPKDLTENKFVSLAKQYSNTEILVIIGYSFPFFNRDIDLLFLTNMNKGGMLRKIIIQSPNNYCDALLAKFPILNTDRIKVEWFNDLSQFYIPHVL